MREPQRDQRGLGLLERHRKPMALADEVCFRPMLKAAPLSAMGLAMLVPDI